jgi:Reversibly glycosylated polypeptide.
MKIGIVIPHHLATLDFLEEWREEFSKRDVFLYIIEDKDNRETSVPEWLNNFTIITHRDIKDCLDKKSWIIPFKTSAIRSFGYYMAWADNCDYILTLDNDCYPENENYWILGHIENLQSKVTLDWVSSLPDSDLETRGFPYMIRDKSPIGVSHGLWSNVPDFDGIDMLKYPEKRFKAELKSKLIPRYSFIRCVA